MKKTLLFSAGLLTLASFQVLANPTINTIQVTNISNLCSCKIVKQKIVCSGTPNPITTQFGTENKNYNFVPANPPVISTPGSIVQAPISVVQGESKEVGLGIVDLTSGATISTADTLQELGNPTALRVVSLSINFHGEQATLAAPFNAAWIKLNPPNPSTPSCIYRGP